jgi:methionyl aminopeptidase
MIEIKTPEDIGRMRRAGRVVAEALEELKKAVVPGVATIDLDRIAERCLKERGARPAFKGYRGYPASVCVSINDEVVHGIPSARELREGDVVSIDLGSFVDGFCGDAAVTLPVGDVDEDGLRLIRVTEEALAAGVAEARVGKRLHDISSAVQATVERAGFSVVRDFVGHGIGRRMHEEPQVPNFGTAGTGIRLKTGMVLAIEPMVNEGSWEVMVDEDHWTVRTKDGTRSAHFEHVVAVTNDGPEILTLVS